MTVASWNDWSFRFPISSLLVAEHATLYILGVRV